MSCCNCDGQTNVIDNNDHQPFHGAHSTMRKLLVFLLTLPVLGAACAQSTDGVGYPSVSAALDALKAKAGVNIAVQGGWTIVTDKAANTLWSFTPQDHPAHPAVVKRTIVSKDGNVTIQMNALCQAAEAPCDKLIDDFTALNEQMRLAMTGKAAPAATAANSQATSAQEQAVERRSLAYYAAKDGHRFEDAYRMQSPSLTKLAPFERWRKDNESAQAGLGPVVRRDIQKVTWYKDPPNGQPGVYAASDFSSKFANADIHCGYLVWLQQSDGSFLLVREEENFIDKETEKN